MVSIDIQTFKNKLSPTKCHFSELQKFYGSKHNVIIHVLFDKIVKKNL